MAEEEIERPVWVRYEKLLEARELLSEAQHMLAHSACRDDDATKCPACSLESRIDAVLGD